MHVCVRAHTHSLLLLCVAALAAWVPAPAVTFSLLSLDCLETLHSAFFDHGSLALVLRPTVNCVAQVVL